MPDSEKAAAIGAFFGVSLDWLINGTETVAPAYAQEQPAPAAVAPLAQPAVPAAPAAVAPHAKQRAGWVKALIIAGIITLASIGVSALSAFIFMLVTMKAANLADPETFYMLLIIVPGWVVLFLAVFIITIIVIRKKQKNKPPQ